MNSRKFKNPLLIFFIIAIVLIGWLLFLNQITASGEKDEIERLVESINHDYTGVVTLKYSTRKGVDPTFLKLKDQYGKVWDISPNYLATENISIGDSIEKIRGENLITVKTSSGETHQYVYELISETQRGHPSFPTEWKNKWPEATKTYSSNK